MAEATEQLRIVLTAQDNASAVVKNVGNTIQSTLSSAVGGAAAGVGFAAFNQIAQSVGQAFGFAKDAIIGFNASLEQSRIAWTTMLGGAQQAQAMLDQLQAFAQATPFSFPEVEQAARRFTAMGIAAGDIIPLMRSVAEGAIAVGGGADAVNRISLALGQMSTRTRVTAEDMMQLTEVGIPAWKILADATGQSVAQIQDSVTKGQVSADTMIAAFQRFADVHWKDLLDTQTFTAAMSNIQDASQRLLADAFQPLFKGLEDVAIRFQNFLQSADVKNFANNVANAQVAVGAFLDTITQSGSSLTIFAGALGGLVGVFIAANWDDLANAAGRFATAVSEKLGALAEWFGSTFAPAVASASATAWEGFANPAMQAFNAVVSAWNQFWGAEIGPSGQTAFQQLQQMAAEGWAGFVDIATEGIRSVLQTWADLIGLLQNLRTAGVPLVGIWGAIADQTINVTERTEGFNQALRQVPGIAGNAAAAFQEFVAWVPTAVERTVAAIQAAGEDLSQLGPNIAAALQARAQQLASAAGTAGKQVGTAFGTGVIQAAKPLLEELARLLAQQAAGPATAALADTQAQIHRAELVMADLSQTPEERAAALRRLLDLQMNVKPRQELEAFDVNEPVRLTERVLAAANLRDQILEKQLALAGQKPAGGAVAISGAGAPTTVAAAAPIAAPPPTRLELHIVVATPDGDTLAVYDELLEANGQAQVPPTIQVSAVRRN